MMNLSGLAYVVAESTDLARWKSYAEDVLGMMTASAPDGGLYLRMDERQFRFAIEPGEHDRYTASGWEVLDQAEFDRALGVLRESKVDFQLEDAAFCARRCVQQAASFRDPSGNRHEVVWGFKSDFTRFVSPVGVPRFVTGEIAMGHVVLPAPEFEKTAAFAKDVMGFGLSDVFNFRPPGTDGVVVPIHFMHCGNARHHSLALAAYPVESGCIHAMVEVADMPEVGRAMDRMAAHGVTQTATLGQHTNDRVTSFYMRCPSNFDIEYGYGGTVVDWRHHVVSEFTRVSLWGHDFTIAHGEVG